MHNSTGNEGIGWAKICEVARKTNYTSKNNLSNNLIVDQLQQQTVS